MSSKYEMRCYYECHVDDKIVAGRWARTKEEACANWNRDHPEQQTKLEDWKE